MNAVSIALEVIRKQPAIKPLAWTSGIIIDLTPDEWLDITDPSAALPPAYVVDAASKRGRE